VPDRVVKTGGQHKRNETFKVPFIHSSIIETAWC